jgi:hypothetical protein
VAVKDFSSIPTPKIKIKIVIWLDWIDLSTTPSILHASDLFIRKWFAVLGRIGFEFIVLYVLWLALSVLWSTLCDTFIREVINWLLLLKPYFLVEFLIEVYLGLIYSRLKLLYLSYMDSLIRDTIKQSSFQQDAHVSFYFIFPKLFFFHDHIFIIQHNLILNSNPYSKLESWLTCK